MKNLLFLLTFFYITNNFAQEKLDFTTRFVESENQWVAFKADSLGMHAFGFIYIDASAGLTLDLSGYFSINENGTFSLKKNESMSSIKYRLENNSFLVAIIPDSHLKELEVLKVPEWLHIYKHDEESIERLYNWGYRYNGWNECAKALTYLEKAYKINPNYKGLRVELAFSYNCLEDFEKAIDVLEVALKKAPNDAYTYKELIYAQIYNNQIDKAVITYNTVVNDVTDTSFSAENAYNIAGAYFRLKDLKRFNRWLKKTNIDKDEQFGANVEHLKKLLENK